MVVRLWQREDYGEIAGWMEARGLELYPCDLLPWSGFVVERGEELLAAAWVYKYSGVGIGVVDPLVTREGLGYGEVVEVAGVLMGCVEEVARDTMGIEVLLAMVWRGGMVREAKRLGFEVERGGGIFLKKQLRL